MPGSGAAATCRSRPRRPTTASGPRRSQPAASWARADAVQRALAGRGRRALRLARLPRRGLLPGRRDGAAGAAGARPARAAARARRRGLRASPVTRARGSRTGRRGAAPPGGVGPGRRPPCWRWGRAAKAPRGAAAQPAHGRLLPHRPHRARAGAARGDRLDRRRVHHRQPRPDRLLPHHPRRPDRLRLGRRPDRDGRAPRRPRRARPRGGRASPPPTSATTSPASTGAASPTPGAARSTPRRPTCRWSCRCAAAAPSPPPATPATASAPPTWSAEPSPRWPSTAATSTPACPSSTPRRHASRRSPSTGSAARRSAAGIMRKEEAELAGREPGPGQLPARPRPRADRLPHRPLTDGSAPPAAITSGRDHQHRALGQVQQLVRGRAEDHALQRRVAVAADDDHPRVALLGDVDQRLGAALRRPARPRSRRPLASACCLRLAHHLLAELLDRLLVFGDLAAPEPRRRVAEDDDDLVAQRPRPARSARVERRLAAVRAVVADDDLAHLDPPPPARRRPAAGSPLRPRGSPAGTTSGWRRKKAGTLRHWTNIRSDAEDQEEDGDHQRRAEPEPGVARFGVGRVGEFDPVLDQQVEEDHAAERRARRRRRRSS